MLQNEVFFFFPNFPTLKMHFGNFSFFNYRIQKFNSYNWKICEKKKLHFDFGSTSLMFNVLKDGDIFQLNIDFEEVLKLPKVIRDEFQQTRGTYEIKSVIQKENAKKFIDYFLNKTSKPVFNSENICDFFILSKEFGIQDLTTMIEEEFKDILQISSLRAILTLFLEKLII